MSAIYNILNTDNPPEIPKILSAQCNNFVSCCLRINPYERLNVYKLLRHPFITNESVLFNQISDLGNPMDTLQKVSENRVLGYLLYYSERMTLVFHWKV